MCAVVMLISNTPESSIQVGYYRNTISCHNVIDRRNGYPAKIIRPLSQPVMGNILAVAVLLVFLLLTIAARGEDNPAPVTDIPMPEGITPEMLEAQKAIIGKILIENQNIFDLDNPLENRWAYRLVNALHIRTRPEVIRRQLLFTEGDVYSVREMEESVRILRSNSYLNDAIIEQERYKNGVVDINVKTIDVWTLDAGLSFGRRGGKNKSGLGLEENNFLGTGTLVSLSYNSTVDRNVTRFEIANQHIHGSRYEAAAVLADNSDGFERYLHFGKPFYSLDSRNALGGSFLSARRTDSIYDRGKIVDQFDHKVEHHEINFGWSEGLREGWTRRFTTGVVYDDHKFSSIPDNAISGATPPQDRRYLFPYLGFEIMEDNFETVSNFDKIHQTEDLYIGTRFAVKLGYSNEAAGSSGSGFHFDGDFSNGLHWGQSTTFLYGWLFGGRFISGKREDFRLSSYANYHWRQSQHRLFYGGLKVTIGSNLDPDNQLLLGGDNGLRGYPLRYQGGNKSALLTLEQRVFTDWYPFRLFHIGGAIFFDAGRTWGDNLVGSKNLGILRDAGIGLRIGNSRSGIGRVIHIDLAFPLDGESDIKGMQVVIETKTGF